MALRTFAVYLWLISGSIVFADEPTTLSEPTVKELLAKIEKLERRIIELESAQQPIAVYQYGASQTPAILSPVQGHRYYRPYPDSKELPPTTKFRPIVPPTETVPRSWRRHEFNGHFYYTIPLGNSNSPPMHLQ
jgi:hypothetical protein